MKHVDRINPKRPVGECVQLMQQRHFAQGGEKFFIRVDGLRIQAVDVNPRSNGMASVIFGVPGQGVEPSLSLFVHEGADFLTRNMPQGAVFLLA